MVHYYDLVFLRKDKVKDFYFILVKTKLFIAFSKGIFHLSLFIFG